jgi:hypothetical protein
LIWFCSQKPLEHETWSMKHGIWFHGIATFYTYFLFPFQIILVKQSNSLILSGILQNYFYINSSCLA